QPFGLIFCDHDFSIGRKVNLDDAGHFTPGRLVVVAEDRAEPVALCIVEEVAAGATGHGFVAIGIWALYVVGDNQHAAISPIDREIIGARPADIVFAVGFEHGRAFVRAGTLAVVNANGNRIAVKAAHVIFHAVHAAAAAEEIVDF